MGIDVPGEYSELEEEIIMYLYEHPDWDTGTFALVRALKPAAAENSTPEARQQRDTAAFKDVQHAVETLYLAKLVKGKRQRAYGGEVYFDELKLTQNGEVAAIHKKRKVIVKEIPPAT